MVASDLTRCWLLLLLRVTSVAATVFATANISTVPADPRDILQGQLMVEDGYLDQPYCTILATGRWVCTITANSKPEGSDGEHVSVLWSDDRGASWSPLVHVEPAPVFEQLDNAYSLLVASDAGAGVAVGGAQRLYCIYNMNTQNITSFPSGERIARTDMMGSFQMRYSDDGGATWSASRYPVPFRLTSIDYGNDWKGNTTIMWSVDQVKSRDGIAYFAFTKIGHYMMGPPEELWLMTSDNILSEADPAAIRWTLLPHGDHGVRPIVGFENTNIEEVCVICGVCACVVVRLCQIFSEERGDETNAGAVRSKCFFVCLSVCVSDSRRCLRHDCIIATTTIAQAYCHF